MWYYSLEETFKKFPKLLIFVILNFIQKNNTHLYTKYCFLDDKVDLNISEFYFLKNKKVNFFENKKDSDCLILISQFNLKSILKNILYFKKMRVVGINFFGHYGINMLINIGYFDFANVAIREEYKEESFNNYKNLKKMLKQKNLYVLGNSPAFSKIIKQIDSQPVFICNDSISLIQDIKSSIVVLSFADPLFHYSYDENALNFINEVKKIEEKINYLIVPSNAIPIIKDAKININFIGITSSKKMKQNFKIRRNKLYTKNTHNILTQYMLPLATNLSKKVILGAVTVNLEPNLDSVWDYDKKIGKATDKSFAFNYSFFKDRNFKKYYKFHNKMLSKILRENSNIEIYE